MIVKYRPQRSTRNDSMNEMKIFASTKKMLDGIVKEWNGLISFDDLIIGNNTGKDNRIDWQETRYICTKRIGKDVYDIPQCIGICSIEGKNRQSSDCAAQSENS